MPTDVTLTIPWSWAITKNGRLKPGEDGRELRLECNKIQSEIAETLKKTGPWYQAKVWLDLYVEMSNRHTDAINVIHPIADAVKRGIGVDDYWFGIHRLDWDVKRDDPSITIRVFQKSDFHEKCCSVCKMFYERSSDNFYKTARTKDGLGVMCIMCDQDRERPSKAKGDKKT